MTVWENVKIAAGMHVVMGWNLHFAVEVKGSRRTLGCLS